jgi:oligopeptide/dipeptide ABC transporter ATP-binding protein
VTDKERNATQRQAQPQTQQCAERQANKAQKQVESMGGDILRVEHLKMYYETKAETVRAVDDVSFAIREGETFGLVGESGCGKSTAARAITRLLPETGRIEGGSILYKGRDIVKMSSHDVRALRGREIGMIFQDPMTALNPVTTVAKQIYESLKLAGMPKDRMHDRAIELLTMVGIPEPEARLKNYVHELSGGMRQRVMIAIALASSPRLMLADEPTTALDVTIQNQIICLLNNLRQQLGMSILLVTHDLGVVNEMCDDVAVMYAGTVVEIAETKAVLYSSLHPYTLGLVRSLPAEHDTRSRLEPIPGMPPRLDRLIKGCPFAPRCPFATDVCHSVAPVKFEAAPGHMVSCHHADPSDRTRLTGEAGSANAGAIGMQAVASAGEQGATAGEQAKGGAR